MSESDVIFVLMILVVLGVVAGLDGWVRRSGGRSSSDRDRQRRQLVAAWDALNQIEDAADDAAQVDSALASQVRNIIREYRAKERDMR